MADDGLRPIKLTKKAQAMMLLETGRYDSMTFVEIARVSGYTFSTIRSAYLQLLAEHRRNLSHMTANSTTTGG